MWSLHKAWGSFFHPPQYNAENQQCTDVYFISKFQSNILATVALLPHHTLLQASEFSLLCCGAVKGAENSTFFSVMHSSTCLLPLKPSKLCWATTMMSGPALHLLKKWCACHKSLLQWLFKGARCCHQICSCCLGPEPWGFDEMLHPPKWHKLRAVIIPHTHGKPGLGILWPGQRHLQLFHHSQKSPRATNMYLLPLKNIYTSKLIQWDVWTLCSPETWTDLTRFLRHRGTFCFCTQRSSSRMFLCVSWFLRILPESVILTSVSWFCYCLLGIVADLDIPKHCQLCFASFHIWTESEWLGVCLSPSCICKNSEKNHMLFTLL